MVECHITNLAYKRDATRKRQNYRENNDDGDGGGGGGGEQHRSRMRDVDSNGIV